MEIVPNLWPEDLIRENLSVPKNFLIKQGEYLKEITNNAIFAEIRSIYTNAFNNYGTNAENLVHEFVLRSESLGNYQLPLLRIIHENTDNFPLTLMFCLTESKKNIPTIDVFKQSIKDIFSDSKTIHAINFIYSQI